MTLEELLQVLTEADRIRIIKAGRDLYAGFLGLLREPKENGEEHHLYVEHKKDKVQMVRFGQEIRHRRWKELGLMAPLKPEETPDYCYKDLQMKNYIKIFI